jgi:thiol-disulfide isomerase/thioredoxin
MKNKIMIIFLMTTISLLASSIPSGWLNGMRVYKVKMNTISEDKIPMILYVYADWCGYCKKMNAKLSNKKVQEYLKGFTKIAINGGRKAKSDQLEYLMKYHGVSGFPTMLLVLPNGNTKRITISTEGTDKQFLNALKRKIGNRAYKMSRKGIKNANAKADFDEKEISDLYSNNGTKPMIIEFSDKVGETSNMRAYKVITEDSTAKFHNNTGDMYLAKNKFNLALNEYLESLKYDKKNQRSYYNLGRCYYLESKMVKGFNKLKKLKNAQRYLKAGESYSGNYLIEIQKTMKNVDKEMEKENKKYKVIK